MEYDRKIKALEEKQLEEAAVREFAKVVERDSVQAVEHNEREKGKETVKEKENGDNIETAEE